MKTIITHPNFQYLGKELEERNPRDIQICPVDFKKFPDGTANIFINDVDKYVEYSDVTYIGDFSGYESGFSQRALLRALVEYNASKVRMIIPYFHTGTMERIVKKGEVATAKYAADDFSSIPSGRDSKNSFHTFDIHALQERFYFNSDRINVDLHTAMRLVRERISQSTSIVFPDDGSEKRFTEEFSGFESIVCSKVRAGDKRIITLKEGTPEGRDVIIVDDLIQSGGTIRETAKVLRSKGAKSVRAFATHGVFPNDSHKVLASELDELVVTDSIPANRERAKETPNMVVLSILPLIEKILRVA